MKLFFFIFLFLICINPSASSLENLVCRLNHPQPGIIKVSLLKYVAGSLTLSAQKGEKVMACNFLQNQLEEAFTVRHWFFSSQYEARQLNSYSKGPFSSLNQIIKRRYMIEVKKISSIIDSICASDSRQLFCNSSTIKGLKRDLNEIKKLGAKLVPSHKIHSINARIRLIVKSFLNSEPTIKAQFRGNSFYEIFESFFNTLPDTSFSKIQSSEKTNYYFEIQQFNVTQRLWVKVVGYNPSLFALKKVCPTNFEVQNGLNLCPLHPVEMITMSQINAFLEKINFLDSVYRYRLPTSEEWEYAAKASSSTAFWFGDTTDQAEKYTWYFPISKAQTHEVGLKLPNRWGLYDMSGNVWQIVVADPMTKTTYSGDGKHSINKPGFVVRGGSWLDSVEMQKIGITSKIYVDWNPYDAGFRLIREPK